MADNGNRILSGDLQRVQSQPTEQQPKGLYAVKRRTQQLVERQHSLHQERCHLLEERDQLSDQLQELSDARDALQSEQTRLKTRLYQLTDQRNSLQQERDTFKAERNQLAGQLQEAFRTAEEERAELDAISSQLEELTEQRNALERTRDNLQAERDQLAIQAKNTENSILASLRDENRMLRTKNEELTTKLGEQSTRSASEKLKLLDTQEALYYTIERLLLLFFKDGSRSGSKGVENTNARGLANHIQKICHEGDVNSAKEAVDTVADAIGKDIVPLLQLAPAKIIAEECEPAISSEGKISFARPGLAESISILIQDSNIKKSSILTFGPRKTEIKSLLDAHGSDKDSNNPHNNILNPYQWLPHSYGSFYEIIFSPIRQSTRLVFECGIGTNNPALPSSMGKTGLPGASLRAWRDYFPKAIIHGADIDKDCLFTEDRIVTHQLDQTDPFSIKRMWQEIDSIDFDIMIDDGLHEFEAGSCLFAESFHLLRSGGIYIIEDVAPIQWQIYIDFFKSRGASGSIVAMEPYDKTAYFDNAMIAIIKD